MRSWERRRVEIDKTSGASLCLTLCPPVTIAAIDAVPKPSWSPTLDSTSLLGLLFGSPSFSCLFSLSLSLLFYSRSGSLPLSLSLLFVRLPIYLSVCFSSFFLFFSHPLSLSFSLLFFLSLSLFLSNYSLSNSPWIISSKRLLHRVSCHNSK